MFAYRCRRNVLIALRPFAFQTTADLSRLQYTDCKRFRCFLQSTQDMKSQICHRPRFSPDSFAPQQMWYQKSCRAVFDVPTIRSGKKPTSSAWIGVVDWRGACGDSVGRCLGGWDDRSGRRVDDGGRGPCRCVPWMARRSWRGGGARR